MPENEKDPREQYANWKAPEITEVASPEINKIFSEAESLSALQSLQSQTEFRKQVMLKVIAKQKGVAPEQALRELREFAKSKIDPEKTKHFHRTSIDNFRQIVQDGALLSRTELKKLHPDMKLSSYSSSDSVMMTRDLEKYDPQNLGPGMRKGVVFVLGPELLKQDTYDAISYYPTVDNAPLDKTTSAVLVDEDGDMPTVQKILSEANLGHIQVFNRNVWLKQQAEQK